MRRNDFFSRKICYILSVILLILLAGLFYLERQQSVRYAREYGDKIKKQSTVDIKETSSEENKTEAEADRNQEDKTDTSSEEEKEDKSDKDSGDSDKTVVDLNAAIQKSLPGIVCWGDAAMKGNDSGSLPEELEQRVDEQLLKEVRESHGDSQDAKKLHIPVANMGVVGEGFTELLVRSGASPLYLGEDYQIPEKTEKNDIVLCDEEGNALRFAKKELDQFGQVTLGKVKGHFFKGSQSYDKSHSNLAFARDAEGDSALIEEGTVVHTASAEDYQNYLPVIFLQDQGDTASSDLVDGIRAIASRYPGKHYAVLLVASPDSEADQMCGKQFKDHYIRVDQAPEDMKQEDYQELAVQVYEILDAQGTFEELK